MSLEGSVKLKRAGFEKWYIEVDFLGADMRVYPFAAPVVLVMASWTIVILSLKHESSGLKLPHCGWVVGRVCSVFVLISTYAIAG